MQDERDNPIEEKPRDLALGAALAALPRPELPQDMDARLRAAVETARRRRRRNRSGMAVALAAAVAAVAFGGAAFAGAFDSGTSQLPGPSLPAESVYPTNAAGQTYGSEKPLVETPDLIRVRATNGRQGYCLKADLDTPYDPDMTPEEKKAILYRALRGHKVPVFASDGVTRVGVFQLGGPGTTSAGGDAEGNAVTITADVDGNIITTTTRKNGTITIETEALDGTITTKTLTAAEAERLKETPSPAPRVAEKPEKPPVWLHDRMTQWARSAGDPGATAHWQLATRYDFRLIEGDLSPKSEYAQWNTVWLIILHGDFRDGQWRFWVLDDQSHNLLSHGASDRPFDTVLNEPLEGPIMLGRK